MGSYLPVYIAEALPTLEAGQVEAEGRPAKADVLERAKSVSRRHGMGAIRPDQLGY